MNKEVTPPQWDPNKNTSSLTLAWELQSSRVRPLPFYSGLLLGCGTTLLLLNLLSCLVHLAKGQRMLPIASQKIWQQKLLLCFAQEPRRSRSIWLVTFKSLFKTVLTQDTQVIRITRFHLRAEHAGPACLSCLTSKSSKRCKLSDESEGSRAGGGSGGRSERPGPSGSFSEFSACIMKTINHINYINLSLSMSSHLWFIYDISKISCRCHPILDYRISSLPCIISWKIQKLPLHIHPATRRLDRWKRWKFSNQELIVLIVFLDTAWQTSITIIYIISHIIKNTNPTILVQRCSTYYW